MKEIQVEIEGLDRILFSPPPVGEIPPPGGTPTRKEDHARAMKAVYRNGNGLYLPALNIKKCLLYGLKLEGKTYKRRSLATYAEGSVVIDPREVLFGINKPDGVQEDFGRRPPKKGGACIIRRAYLEPGWKLCFTLGVYDERALSDTAIEEGLMRGGQCSGLGDWRPYFGKFKVVKFEPVAK